MAGKIANKINNQLHVCDHYRDNLIIDFTHLIMLTTANLYFVVVFRRMTKCALCAFPIIFLRVPCDITLMATHFGCMNELDMQHQNHTLLRARNAFLLCYCFHIIKMINVENMTNIIIIKRFLFLFSFACVRFEHTYIIHTSYRKIKKPNRNRNVVSWVQVEPGSLKQRRWRGKSRSHSLKRSQQ